MDTETLESLLEGGAETQTLDYKASCPWDEPSFAKDILAFSNVRDGGRIIIGVKERDDHSFERQGVQELHRRTFDFEAMRDQISNYADPFVTFTGSFVQDKQGKEYVVIEISPFPEIPVICKKQSNDTKAGVIYYRTLNRRPESAPVSNSYALRDILERGAVKLAQRHRELGLRVESGLDEKLDEELEGL